VRRYSLLMLCLIASGCAATPKTAQTDSAPLGDYTEASASALAFDPPIAEGAVHPELARGPRNASAVFGYQQSTVETYTSATDDQQTNLWGDFFIRESVSVKSGVNYR